MLIAPVDREIRDRAEAAVILADEFSGLLGRGDFLDDDELRLALANHLHHPIALCAADADRAPPQEARRVAAGREKVEGAGALRKRKDRLVRRAVVLNQLDQPINQRRLLLADQDTAPALPRQPVA